MGSDEGSGPITQPPADGLVLVLLLDLALLVEDLSRGGEPARQPYARGLHEPAQVAVGNRANGLRPHPSGDRPGEVHDVPAPRGQQVERTLEPSGERQVRQPEHPDEDRQWQHPQQRGQAVVLEHRHDGGSLLVVALRPPMTLGGAFAGRRRVPMTGARERRHQDVEPRQSRTPAEVEVVVPAVQRSSNIPIRCHASREINIAHVETNRTSSTRSYCPWSISPGPAAACTGDRTGPRTGRPPGGGAAPPSPRPWARRRRRARRASDRRLDEPRHRIGFERGVVVKDQEVVGGPRGGDLERRADRSGQASAFGGDDAPVAERLPEQVRTRRSTRRRPRRRPSADRSVRRATTGTRGAIRRRPVRRGRPRPRARVQEGFRWTIQSCDALPRGAEPSRPGPRTSGRGAHRPPSHVAPTSAQRLRAAASSCRLLRRRACGPQSSACGRLPACGRLLACGRLASRGLLTCGRLPACGRLLACGRLASRGLLACGRLPACGRLLACGRLPRRGLLRAAACGGGLPACGRLAAAVFLRPRACERRSSACGRLAGRRLLAAVGLPGCCHAALPSRFPWI